MRRLKLKTQLQTIVMCLCIGAVVFTSCKDNTEEEIKVFVDNFATALANKDTKAIKELYPDASRFNSLIESINTSNMVITKEDVENTYKVKLDDDIDLTIESEGKGKYKIIESHHLLTLNTEIEGFARRTGWYNPDLSDKENSTRLRDRYFPDACDGMIVQLFKEKVIVETKPEIGEDISWTVTVKNNNEVELSANAYSIEVVIAKHKNAYSIAESDFEPEFYGESGIKTDIDKRWVPGMEVAPHSSKSYTYNEKKTEDGEIVDITTKAEIHWRIPDVAIVSSYEYTGDEYEEYLRRK